MLVTAAATHTFAIAERGRRGTYKEARVKNKLMPMRIVVFNITITISTIVHNLTVHKFTAKNSGSLVPAGT